MMNKQYFTYLLKKNKKMLLVLFAITIALYCISNVNTGYLYGVVDKEKIFLYACITIIPIYIHLKNYKQNGNDLLLSLPISKEKRYLNELVFGWLLIMLPYLAITVVKYLMGTDERYLHNSIYMLIRNILILFPYMTLYLMNAFIAVKSNNLIDAIILIITINFGIYILPNCLVMFFNENEVAKGIGDYFSQHKEMGGLISNKDIIESYFSPYAATRLLKGYIPPKDNAFTILNTSLIFIYFIYSIILGFLNIIYYRNKKSETCGERTTSRLGYPLAIILITFILITCVNVLHNLLIVFICYLFIFVVYIGAYWIAERKLSISFKKIGLFVGIIACSLVLRTSFVYTYGFSTYHSYRSIEDVDELIIRIYDFDSNVSFLSNVSSNDDKKQQELKAILIDIQDQLVEDYRTNNLWWYKQPLQSKTHLDIYYNGDKTYAFNKSYSYILDKEVGEEIIKHLRVTGMIEEEVLDKQ